MESKNIAFIDIEGYPEGKDHRFGIVCNDINIKTTSAKVIKDIILEEQPKYICGHNFIDHDMQIIQKYSLKNVIKPLKIIDTLYLSILLHPGKSSHRLDKPYKSEIFIENQPAADCEQTKELLLQLNEHFLYLTDDLQNCLFNLLRDNPYFKSYFDSLNFHNTSNTRAFDLLKPISHLDDSDLNNLIEEFPTETAILCSDIFSSSNSVLSPIILHKFPEIPRLRELISFDIRDVDNLITTVSQTEFGFASFRDFASVDQGLFRVSQKDIIEAGVIGESILVVLPTGGGKTFTFQLPAVIKAETSKTLTVVVSPLQALMKNHTDNFNMQIKNYKAAALSGFLDPISRLNTLEEIRNGSIDILYLAPEALRSTTVFRALQTRVIERFVIDEAHCFSAWGHDFRHDYFYIGKCIAELEKADYQKAIPISCFTATARPQVLDDIREYFNKTLDRNLTPHIASSERTNLNYSSFLFKDDSNKYEKLIELISDFHEKPMIIYRPQNARGCRELARKLNQDERLSNYNLIIEPFYARMDDDISKDNRSVQRKKNEVLDDFINNIVNIVIATTAFGMGIDKPDIQAVIHYDPSDSLEAYTQESGRGARSKDITAECVVLYSEADFERIFRNLCRTKVDYDEIFGIAQFLKRNKKNSFQASTRQIAENIGLDIEDTAIDYDNIIKTAILELEKWDIIQRGKNHTRLYGTGLLNDPDNPNRLRMDIVHEVLDPKEKIYGYRFELMIKIMQNIIQRSKNDVVEIEDLAAIVGIDNKEIHQLILDLQHEGLIEYYNDITVIIDEPSKKRLKAHFDIEEKIFNLLLENNNLHKIDLRILNTSKEKSISHRAIRILNSWRIIGKIIEKDFKIRINKFFCSFSISEEAFSILKSWIIVRRKICDKIISYCLHLSEEFGTEEIVFSTTELYDKICETQNINLEFYHHCLVYLNETIDNFEITSGRLIYYQSLSFEKDKQIERHTPYHVKEYKNSLEHYYKMKIEAIHILTYFYKSLETSSWQTMKSFVADYFNLPYDNFKQKYRLDTKYLQLAITSAGYKKIMGKLNEEQKTIVDDKESKAILVLAGPGSGKTMTLVHKIASLITIEKNKPEYFLMLTHSRVAAKEFKNRLRELIGFTSGMVEIFTFHAYASLIVEKIIEDEKDLNNLIPQATKLIENGSYKPRLKTMLVLDEFQDISDMMYNFIKAIYSSMGQEKKIIAVGDDDQCINNFNSNKSNPLLMNKFLDDFKDKLDSTETEIPVKIYKLLKNYRSNRNIIKLTNLYARTLPGRMKSNDLIPVKDTSGALQVFQYHQDCFKNKSYLSSIADKVSSDHSNEIAILLWTNDEVLTLYSLLKLKKCNVQYITDNDGFQLGNLIELQSFITKWRNSKNYITSLEFLKHKFHKSRNYKLANHIIEEYFADKSIEALLEAPIIYMNDFEEYLKHIKSDEFNISDSKIIVSTMHKSKGKEFETVYAGINNNICFNDYSKRLFYVAMTRAKERLFLHTTNGFIQSFNDDFENIINIDYELDIPKQISFSMTLKDLWLGHTTVQKNIKNTKPIAGEKVEIQVININNVNSYSILKNGLEIGKLSKPSMYGSELNVSQKIVNYEKTGYQLNPQCEVENVVYWIDHNNHDKRFIQVLCRITMIHL